MTYEAILTALADPTRRAVLERLRGGALSVARIAEGLPVSRPAVSQHLRVLLEAGLVSRSARGTSNHYTLVAGAAAPLLRWLDDMRDPGERAPAEHWSMSVRVGLSPEPAWRLFCDDLASWWPTDDTLGSVRLDAAEGGSLRGILADGTEEVLATVAAVDRPAQLVLDWGGDGAGGSRVSIGFAAEGEGCRVTCRLGPGACGAFALWDAAMARFAAAGG